MMNDTFQSVLQQTTLIHCWFVKRKLEIAFCEFRQLWYMRSDGRVVVKKPHNADLISPSGHAPLQCSESIYSCSGIFGLNTPKGYVDIAQKPLHRFRGMICTDIY